METLRLDEIIVSEEDSVRKLISTICPSWQHYDIKVESMTEGCLNDLWKCSNISSPDEAIVVKLFGAGVNSLFNRKREKEVIDVLNSAGVLSHTYCMLVIHKMHQIHSWNPSTKSDWMKEDIFLVLTPSIVTRWKKVSHELSQTEPFRKNFPPLDVFNEELMSLFDMYKELEKDFPFTLCHGDMHRLNIIYDQQKANIQAVDWEFSGFCAEVMDIGSHFIRDPDISFLYEGDNINRREDYVRWFMQTYLQTHPEYHLEAKDDKILHKWIIGAYKAMFIQGLLGIVIILPLEDPEGLIMKCGANQYKVIQEMKKKWLNNSAEGTIMETCM